MNLKGIVAVSGKPGLWKALAQNKSGFILESVDEQKTKLVANLSTAKVAALEEITVFGNSGDIRLTEILERMKTADKVPDPKSDSRELRTFFRNVAPDHDEEKVYASDVKKIVSWFHVLRDLPLFSEVIADEMNGAEVAAAAPGNEENESQPAPVKKAKAAKK